ncbi:MAG: hypothetical protein A3H35_02275 [Betaproteobacteria bacterium RIFCSPLOWO2_02_FULL_62_17]|nr:MAG: hypothetical protein A3H35_02275 [Betaproteobacteria bacterium RIFCSPLOWO2_02_FULL_62_17]
MALAYRIKARAKREIEKAAAWWAETENRLDAPGAVRKGVEGALKILVEDERAEAALLLALLPGNARPSGVLGRFTMKNSLQPLRISSR